MQASLGATLATAGRGSEALAELNSALGRSSGAAAARIRVRLGSTLQILGRPQEAIAELRAAARTLRRAGDATWEARAVVSLAQPYLDIGDTRHAEVALIRGESLLENSELTLDAAMARQNRGWIATLDGRVPDALEHYDVAEQRYAAAGARPAELYEARAAALLSAGLFADALTSAEQAVEILTQRGASPAFRAHALVRASDAALAVGKSDLAIEFARAARRLFERQDRERGATLARIGAARARYAHGERSRRLLDELATVAAEAGRRRMVEAVEANLLAGELSLELGDATAATVHLGRAQRARTSRSDLGKVLGWRATALQARAAGRRAALLRACDAGLRVLDMHQRTLGALETRAAATMHGRPLASMALAEAVGSGDATLMLWWAERWRATTLGLPPARTRDDAEFAAGLAQLRLARRRLEDAVFDGQSARGLEREVAELEADVRARTLRTGADDAASGSPLKLPELLGELTDLTLVEMFSLGNALHVLVASAAGVRHHVAGGSYEVAQRTVDFAKFALRRMTLPRAAHRAQTSVVTLGAALERDLLGAAADELGGGAVVIVPPAALSSAPWGMLPSLRGRPFSITPSAAVWHAAHRADPGRDRKVALVAGPRLRQADVEVSKIAQLYPHAIVLGADAEPTTAEAALAALDGAWLAHVAAHGTFRTDNPMFSALLLDDGPLTIFDLQRLDRAPYRLVLSCCDAGAVAPAGAGEMLGVLSALVPLGTAGLVAAATPVSDEAAIGFASLVHDRLRAGGSTAQALCDARLSAADNPAEYAISHAFLAYGAV